MPERLFVRNVDSHMKSCVGRNFVRNLVRGEFTLRMDKVNQLLSLFDDEFIIAKRICGRQRYTVRISLQAGTLTECTDNKYKIKEGVSK